MNRQQWRNLIFGIFTLGAAGAGVAVTSVINFSDAPAIHAGALNLRSPCIGNTCFVDMVPTAGECGRLFKCGGEPCGPDPATQTEPYGGAQGKLGRVLRDAMNQEAIVTYHTAPTDTVGNCRTTLILTPDQRRAWRQIVDVSGIGSEVVDGRRASLPGGIRDVVPAGVDPNATESEESDDAGPGVDGGF